MTDNPRLDDKVKYAIPVDLYADILAFLGIPYAALVIIRCCAAEVWITGTEIDNLLSLCHVAENEKGDGLANELWLTVTLDADCEPVELQEVK